MSDVWRGPQGYQKGEIMNRRHMINTLGIFGVGMTLLPSLVYASEPTNVSKWEPTGLLDGLSDKAKTKMIVLLDNTERQLGSMATDKHITATEMEFARNNFLAITRDACEPFLDDDRFQTMKLPGGYASNGMFIVAKSAWSKICVNVSERGLDDAKYTPNFVLNNYVIPLRDSIDDMVSGRHRNSMDDIVNGRSNMVTYMYIPIIHCPLVKGPTGYSRYAAFIRYAYLRNGPRESV